MFNKHVIINSDSSACIRFTECTSGIQLYCYSELVHGCVAESQICNLGVAGSNLDRSYFALLSLPSPSVFFVCFSLAPTFTYYSLGCSMSVCQYQCK